VTVSQAPTDRKDVAFDGRIQLNGDAAPELEVIVELDQQFIVLAHSSGELGRWARNAVQVAPIGRGWFTLDVEDETVTFLPRRPGHFAAATVDLVPVEEIRKRFRGKARDKKAKEPQTPALSRKERKRLRSEEAAPAALASAEPAVDLAPPAVEPAAATFEPGPAPDVIETAPPPVEQPPGEPAPTPAPEIRPPSARPQPAAEPTSPWDDLPVPEVPGRKPRDKKRPRSAPKAPPRPAPEKESKPVRDKAPKPPKPPRTKAPKPPRGAVELAGAARTVKPAGPKKTNLFSRALAGFWHGLKGIALRISDELRQTGIVPFDRLPAAPARTRPNESHEHDFQEHRLPGGLLRNVCHSCGLVSIGESGEDV
jgi:hypothetical protein